MCPQLYPVVYRPKRCDFRFWRDIGKFVCFFVFFYVCPPLAPPRPTGHSFRDIWVKICMHITLGGIHPLFKKFWGSDPPGGEFFPQIFCKISIWKYKGVMALTQKKICKQFFGDVPPGLGGIASKVLELRFLNFSTRLHATVLEISGWKFAGT